MLGDGTPLGRVRAVHDFGAGDTLEIERAGGPPVMVPFTRAVVPVVDLAAGRLVVDPPPGLFDDGGAEAAGPAVGEDGMTWQATVLTIFPEMLPGPLAYSLAGKALRRRAVAARNGGHPRLRDAISTARSTTRRSAAGRAW